MPKITKRMDKILSQRDRDTVRDALIRYAHHNGFKGKDLKYNQKTLELILPFCAKLNTYWEVEVSEICWRGSTFAASGVEHLKNLLRDKGCEFDKKLEEYSEYATNDDESDDEDKPNPDEKEEEAKEPEPPSVA